MLGITEGAIKNGESIDTAKIRHTIQNKARIQRRKLNKDQQLGRHKNHTTATTCGNTQAKHQAIVQSIIMLSFICVKVCVLFVWK